MDLLNNTNIILGIIASCLTIVATVIPILVRPRKSAPSSTSQNKQLEPLSPVLAAEPVPLISRVQAAIFGLIVGIIVFAIVLTLLSVIVNFILGNRSYSNWFVIILYVFVFLLPTLLGIFFAIAMGERYLDFQQRGRRARLESEEFSRRARLESEEFERRSQMQMDQFRHRFNVPRKSDENRPNQ